MLMRGVIGNGTVCGCPAPRNHMKLASPLVRVLILYVARYCLRGPLLDLSRENETGQPARVKHCRSPSTAMPQSFHPQDALALGVCLRLPHARSSTPALGTQTLLLLAPAPAATAPVARHSTWVANLVLERGAIQRSPPPSPCSATGSRCLYSSQGCSSLFLLPPWLRQFPG